jgi:hypothetical protein
MKMEFATLLLMKKLPCLMLKIIVRLWVVMLRIRQTVHYWILSILLLKTRESPIHFGLVLRLLVIVSGIHLTVNHLAIPTGMMENQMGAVLVQGI